MAVNNDNLQGTDLIADKLDKIFELLAHQSQSQYGQTFGSSVRTDVRLGGSSLWGGRDITRKRTDKLTNSDIQQLLKIGGHRIPFLTENEKLLKDANKLLDEEVKQREKLIGTQARKNEELAAIDDQTSEEAEKLKEALSKLTKSIEEKDKKINEKQKDITDNLKQRNEFIHNNKGVIQGAAKRERSEKEYEQHRETHRMKWYSSAEAYERHKDFIEDNQLNRNDLQMGQNLVNQMGLTQIDFLGIGNAINKGFNAANQVLNIGDSISQVRSMFGGGGGNNGGMLGRIMPSGGSNVATGGGQVESMTARLSEVAGESGTVAESLGSVSSTSMNASASMTGMGSAAAGAAAALAPVAVAAGAVVAAFEIFKAAVGAAAAYLSTAFGGTANLAQQESQRLQDQAQTEETIKTREQQRDSNIAIQENAAWNANRVADAQAAAAISVAKANVEAQKRIMEADIAARKKEINAEIGTGLLKDGINATAWNALRRNIELKAMGETQTAEKKKLGAELSATETEQGAIAGATHTYQGAMTGIVKQRERATAESDIRSSEASWNAANRSNLVDQFATANKTKIEMNTNIPGRVAEFYAENPNLANVTFSGGIATGGLLSAVGAGPGQALREATGGDLARDMLTEGINIGGTNVSVERGRYRRYLDNGFMATRDDIPMPTGEEDRNVDRIIDITNGTGLADYIFNTEDLKKTMIDFNAANLKHDSQIHSIRTQGAVARENIIAGASATMASATAAATQQIATINASAAAQKAKIDADATAQIEKRWIEAGKNIETAWLEMAQKMEEFIGEWEEMTNDYGISQGILSQTELQKYEKQMFRDVEQVTSKFGVDMEKLVEMRAGYNEATNRNIQLNDHDLGQMSAFYKMMGKDSGIVAEYTGAMEIFNHGIDASVDSIDKAMQSANKIGINGRKFVKEVTQNLKLAQKYNFKEGTQGLMKMTEWAMKTRFNMQSLGGMIDKILDGGLEGVIEQSSRLQVLGGNAAIYSDPFSMMYNAGADPAALGEQFQNMTKGLGSIDRKTGETTFNWNENMLLREIAKNQGRDVSDVMDEVRARNRRDSVKLAMSAAQKAKFTEDQIDYMGNLAQYDKESGGFVVNVWDKESGQYVKKGINEVSEKDIENLQPASHDERMEEYVLDIRSGMEKITGEEIREKANIGVELVEEYIKQMTERAGIAYEKYAENRDIYIKNIKEKWQEATDAFEDILGNLKTESNNLDESTNRAARSVNTFAEAVESATRRINGTTGSRGSVNDAYIAGNGHSMFGTASKVTPINDGYVTNPADEGLIGKSGGWVDKLINGIYTMVSEMYNNGGGRGNMNLNVNGSLRLDSNGQSIDLISELRNNPLLVREITAMIFRQGSMNMNGGKGKHPWNDDSGNTYYA